jgi:cold shock CspA family protein
MKYENCLAIVAFWSTDKAFGILLDCYGKTHLFHKPALRTSEESLQSGTLVTVDLEGRNSGLRISRVSLAEGIEDHPDVLILKQNLDAYLWQSEQQRLEKINVSDKEAYYGFTQTRNKNKFKRRKEAHGDSARNTLD